MVWGNSPTGQAFPASFPSTHSLMSWSEQVFFDLQRNSIAESIEKTPSTSPMGHIYLQKLRFSYTAPITTARAVKKRSRYAVLGGLRVNMKRWRSAAKMNRNKITAIQRLRYFSGYFFL